MHVCDERLRLEHNTRHAGKSIVDVHLKDFNRKEDGYAWVNLGDGDVDWPAVREAFAGIGYSGSAIVIELQSGDEAYLRDSQPPRRSPAPRPALNRPFARNENP